jgi:hypothetical protein
MSDSVKQPGSRAATLADSNPSATQEPSKAANSTDTDGRAGHTNSSEDKAQTHPEPKSPKGIFASFAAKIQRPAKEIEIAQDYVEGDKSTTQNHAGRDLYVIYGGDGRPRHTEPAPGEIEFDGDFAAWQRKATGWDVCLIVAVAVQHGAPYAIVNEVARTLKERLPLPKPKDEDLPDPLGGSRARSIDQTLARVGAVCTNEPLEVTGMGPEEHVTFKNPDWKDIVLRAAWNDPHLRTAVPPWLAELGRHSWHEVRLRAAQSAAVLFKVAPAQIVDNVIVSWTRSDVPRRHRWMAARALSFAAHDKAQTDTAFRVLYQFADGERGEGPAAAAALSLGTGLHSVDMKRTINLLGRLCENWSR